MLVVCHPRRVLACGSFVAVRLIGDEYPWGVRHPPESLMEAGPGGLLVEPALPQDVDSVAVLIARQWDCRSPLRVRNPSSSGDASAGLGRWRRRGCASAWPPVRDDVRITSDDPVAPRANRSASTSRSLRQTRENHHTPWLMISTRKQ
jgi:hypothetical protein